MEKTDSGYSLSLVKEDAVHAYLAEHFSKVENVSSGWCPRHPSTFFAATLARPENMEHLLSSDSVPFTVVESQGIMPSWVSSYYSLAFCAEWKGKRYYLKNIECNSGEPLELEDGMYVTTPGPVRYKGFIYAMVDVVHFSLDEADKFPCMQRCVVRISGVENENPRVFISHCRHNSLSDCFFHFAGNNLWVEDKLCDTSSTLTSLEKLILVGETESTSREQFIKRDLHTLDYKEGMNILSATTDGRSLIIADRDGPLIRTVAREPGEQEQGKKIEPVKFHRGKTTKLKEVFRTGGCSCYMMETTEKGELLISSYSSLKILSSDFSLLWKVYLRYPSIKKIGYKDNEKIPDFFTKGIYISVRKEDIKCYLSYLQSNAEDRTREEKHFRLSQLVDLGELEEECRKREKIFFHLRSV